MLYHFEKGWNAAESHFAIFRELFDEGTISKSQVERFTPHCLLTGVFLWVEQLAKRKSSFF